MCVVCLRRRVYEELLAVPVTKGKKSTKEQFAGAFYTTTVEVRVRNTAPHHTTLRYDRMRLRSRLGLTAAPVCLDLYHD
jgi:hypothetical protein